MNQIFKYSTILFLFALGACSKAKLPPDQIEEPVFMVSANIGQDSINWIAGDNNMYMFTDYYTLNNYRALMGKFLNTADSSYLQFDLIGLPNTTLITQLNSNTFAGYTNTSSSGFDTTYTYTFAPLYSPQSSTPVSYLWNFGNGDTTSFMNPTRSFSSTGIKNVTLVTTSNTFCIDTISNYLDANTDNPCHVQFSYNYDSLNNIYTFVADQGFTSYIWDFGDGTGPQTTTGPSVTHAYQTVGQYIVSVNANKVGCSANYSQHIGTSPNFCGAGFTYDLIKLLVPTGITNDKTFIVSYKNKGSVYSSYKSASSGNQAGQINFTLNNFSLYNQNEKGQNTVKINGRVSGWLYNVNNYADSIYINTQNLTFAVAYPQ